MTSSDYNIQLTITATVYVRDGRVTGIDAEQGWGDPFIERVEGNEVIGEVPMDNVSNWEDTEQSKALAPLTGKWDVSQI